MKDRENFRRQDVGSATFRELSHPSSVLPETKPVRRCRESSERLSNRPLRGERQLNVAGELTVHPSSPQIPSGKELSNGSSPSCTTHSASKTGSSKLLRQQAKATAVASPPEKTSSPAMSLKISSTLRQACIESRKCV